LLRHMRMASTKTNASLSRLVAVNAQTICKAIESRKVFGTNDWAKEIDKGKCQKAINGNVEGVERDRDELL
jgi:hypothetical protein